MSLALTWLTKRRQAAGTHDSSLAASIPLSLIYFHLFRFFPNITLPGTDGGNKSFLRTDWRSIKPRIGFYLSHKRRRGQGKTAGSVLQRTDGSDM